MFYYVYILNSVHHHKFYIGFTTDLIKRVKQHNHGESSATRPYIPYKLIYYEAFLSKLDGLKREEYFKSGYGLRTIKKNLKNYLNNLLV